MLNTPPALIICSDAAQPEKTVEIVEKIGLQSVQCASLTDARALLEQNTFSIFLCHDDLPDCNLRTAVRVLSSSANGVPVIVLSHLADWDAYMKALNAGAFDYIACPPDPVEAERIVRLALNQTSTPRRAAQTAA
jgi:two-component system, NtrC family, response regulator PilR